ncbi:MAG: hypothetical protein HYR55_20680 [Acidobacteria bacterium]|nr:hypothetical protein [Acidobacteriota bacterium]MBI3656980.1 hypothetical protein [Acidobacteriota bacterium]
MIRKDLSIVTILVLISVAAVGLPMARAQEGKVVGSKEESKWSPTTTASATSPENKKALEKGKPITVTGEIVDASCYIQLGKKGTAHIDCGRQCIMNGQPVGVVDGKDQLYLIMAEQHDPRKLGKVDIKKIFADLMAKTVTVNGIMNEAGGVKTIYVQGRIEEAK